MGVAIDTILGTHAGAASTAFSGITRATGTPSTVRNFSQANWAQLTQIIVGSGTLPGAVRIKSPLLVTNVNGITAWFDQNPGTWFLPPTAGQKVYPGDTLTVAVAGTTAAHYTVAYSIYYQTLPGASARLFNPGTVLGNIAYIKPIHIAVTASTTIGHWKTTKLTTTEKLLRPKSTYAILGYISTAALTFVGVKGTFTSNFRVGGPGTVTMWTTTRFFVNLSNLHGLPHIPVFSATTQTAITVCVADKAATTASKITLICAQLANPLPGTTAG